MKDPLCPTEKGDCDDKQTPGEDSEEIFGNYDCSEVLEISVGIPYGIRPKKTFQFRLDDSVWTAKQAVLMEFGQMNLSDPLNFGFYLPPHNGRAGKFLDEERPLKDYPMTKEQPFLEFRYKRKIFRALNMDEKKLLKVNSKAQQRKFLDQIVTCNIEKVTLMLERGIDPNFQDEKTGETPLTTSVTTPNSSEFIRLLVGQGTHLDYRTNEGLTALHKAAIAGNADALKTLLDLGASPNSKDAKGLTPLYHTVIEGSNSHCCELLLADYAQTGVVDHQGIQEIHQACRRGRVQHLEFLLYYGVDVNSRTASGNTPLHICALSNQEESVRLLLCRGAERDLVNYSNQSAYEVAILAGHPEIAALIKEFQDSDVQPFSTTPKYTNRGRGNKVLARVRSYENLLSPPSPFLKRAISDSTMESKMIRVPASDSSYSLPDSHSKATQETFPDVESGDSDSDDSDSDDGRITIKRRTFSNAGVGTPRAPAPIKSTPGGSAHLKSRLYASVPGRHFVAMTDYVPNAPGELALEKGEQVEVLYVGEQGFWEGRVNGKAGWFPSSCVQEVKKSKKSRPKTWFGTKKSNSVELLEKINKFERPTPRKVSLKRNEKGFGFQLRGANSHAQRIDFTPTPQFPALQYIGEVDKGGVADKAGLKPGDFILEVNGEDVMNASHGYTVTVINKGGKTLTMKVVTVAPECMSPDLNFTDSAVTGTIKRQRSNSFEKKPPPPKPPTRSPYTCLTMGRMSGAALQAARDDLNRVPREDTVVAVEKKDLSRKSSVKSIWSESAWKLRANDPTNFQGENISRSMGRRQDDILRGSARVDKVKSLDFERHMSSRDDIAANGTSRVDANNPYISDVANDIRPIGVNYPGYLTLPRKSSRKSSESSDEESSRLKRRLSSSSQSGNTTTVSDGRAGLPPDYEHTMENLRKMGRKPAYSFDETMVTSVENGGVNIPRRNTTPSNLGMCDDSPQIVEIDRHRNMVHAQPQMPTHAAPTSTTPTTKMPEFRPSLVEGASYRTLPRSTSVPANPPQPMVVQQRNVHTERHMSDSHVSEPHEPVTAFEQSLANAVKRREKRVSQSSKDIDTIIQENRRSIIEAKDVTSVRKSSEEEATRSNMEVKVTLNGDESPKGINKLIGAENLLQRRDSKGSDYFSLYTSSSTASLDSQCSKDSGIDTSPLGSANDVPPDHASALAHAVAARAARLVSKENKEINDSKRGPSTVDCILNQQSRTVVEEVSLVKPSSLFQDGRPKSGSFGTSGAPVLDKLEPLRNAFTLDSESESKTVMSASTSPDAAVKVPPPTKPKPSGDRRGLSQGSGARESKLEVVPEDPRGPGSYIAAVTTSNSTVAQASDSNRTIVSPPSIDHEREKIAVCAPPDDYKDLSLQTTGRPRSQGSLSENASFNISMANMTDEDLATMYLDEVICDAAATIDSDVVSVRSLKIDIPRNKEGKQGKIPPPVKSKPTVRRTPSPVKTPSIELHEDVIIPPPPPPEISLNADVEFSCTNLPPPVMFTEYSSLAVSNSRESSPLPPPPEDFLDDGFVMEDENKNTPGMITGGSVSDPPPPYSPPRVCLNVPDSLADKSYADWNVEDVLCWLEYINMSQYKSAFLDNDIRGVHLPDLTKDDLAELGIKKLGHRMTIDDAIAKLCRAFSEV